MRVLITGGAGFIGSNLAKYHAGKGDDVIIVDNLSTGNKENLREILAKPNVSFYQEDILTWCDFGSLLHEIDRVYHLASVVGMFAVLSSPVYTLKMNFESTFRLYELLQALPKKPLVIIASSSEVYGNQKAALTENSALIVESSSKNQASYSISKLGEESIATAFYHQYHIPCIILRIFNTIGFNQSEKFGMVVPRFIAQALQNQDITIFADGLQTRSFCDVRDIVTQIGLLANNPKAVGEVFNIGNDKPISIIALAKLIKRLSHSQSNLVHVPLKDVYNNEDLFVSQRKPCLAKMVKNTGFEFQWTLKDTLQDIIIQQQF